MAASNTKINREFGLGKDCYAFNILGGPNLNVQSWFKVSSTVLLVWPKKSGCSAGVLIQQEWRIGPLHLLHCLIVQ